MSEKAFPLADAELTIALQDLVQVREPRKSAISIY